jgi:hypothetical protein
MRRNLLPVWLDSFGKPDIARLGWMLDDLSSPVLATCIIRSKTSVLVMALSLTSPCADYMAYPF